MDQYIVSARKYRPSTFSSVVGQKALTSTLKNAIATNRLAHAYLFCGSRGVGKTSCARIFAKTINCEHPTADGDPCNECDSCRDFNQGRSLNILELDAASNNGVEDIRDLIAQVQVPPTSGSYRVFIIDEVHMLSPAAFNAFLKTLEEPPSYVIFILATTEKHKIIPTIMSRCQIYDFNRITIADMVDHLAYVASNEGIEAERSALRAIALKADGAMRDALSIFDQVAASSRNKITYQSTIENLNMLDTEVYGRLLDAFIEGNVPQALLIYKDVRDRGFDSHFFINGLGQHLRDLMVAMNPATQSLLDYEPETIEQLAAQAKRCTPEFFYSAMSLCNSADMNYRQSTNKTFLVELLLIKLCQLLSPSPNYSGAGEGQLKPIATTSTPATPSTPSKPSTSSTPSVSSTPSIPSTPSTSQPPQHIQPPQPAMRRTGVRATRLTLQGAVNPAEPKTQPKVERATRHNEFTHDQLIKAWMVYISAHPEEHILVNTMRVAHPQPTDTPAQYMVTVQNDIQLNTMHRAMPQLIDSLRNALANYSITLTVNL
ncbi:MAG: DNA polymerase III subunit gamma/tau, partial [Muribaculaceae bacterium]|nr:DNA polymerase III subunit gamma/tau [Muribaculaceae bacterium]